MQNTSKAHTGSQLMEGAHLQSITQMDRSFVSFKNMHIPSREELHLKTKEQNSTSSTNTILWRWYNFGSSNWLCTETQEHSKSPFSRREPESSSAAQKANGQHSQVYAFHPMCWKPALQEIFENLTQTSINKMRLESLMYQNWHCSRISQALPMPWCHYAGRAEQFSRKHCPII